MPGAFGLRHASAHSLAASRVEGLDCAIPQRRERTVAQAIGEAAGKIWSYLNENGDASVSAVVRKTGLNRAVAERAIGWLAREDKLVIEKQKNAEIVRLR